MRRIRIVVVPLFLFIHATLGLTCLGQDTNCITVRVLNSKNGKPVKGVEVTFVYYVENGKENVKKTDKLGIVSDCISGPLPTFFGLSFYGFDQPSEEGGFDTETVMTRGIVTSNPGRGAKPKFTIDPKPGEVVVFGRRWWLIERWLGPWP